MIETHLLITVITSISISAFIRTCEGVEFGAEMVCGRMGGLSKRQREICKSSPEAMIAIADGIKLAMDECHHQFNYHRWNCSALNKKHSLGYVITVGSREAAFTYSIVSGGVSYAISRACSRGELSTCGCDLSSSNAHASWKWSGCGVDVNYGVKLARKFLDAREIEFDARSRMNLHNNKAGRMAVKNNMVEICKCHGVSGSCSLKTCWKGLPQFRRIGTHLMEKYHRARRGVWNRSGGLLTMKKKLKPRGTDLIYLEPSPNYCQANANLGSLGTKGRTCNKTSTGMASCNVLCCGRGYNTYQYLVSKQCNCKFHWCCYVQCSTCTDLVQVHTCK
uniref:Protein Wnt n=5 Tax=Lygus hesperus TaxID=30085 RepID=A0A0K8TIQ2_LYGHE